MLESSFSTSPSSLHSPQFFALISSLLSVYLLPAGKKDGSTSPPTSPTSGPRTHFTTEEVMNLYVKNGHRIFNRTLRQKIMTLGGVGDEKYKSDGLEKMIKEHAGDLWLSELLKVREGSSAARGEYWS